ncbi:hypothetical protein [Solidesulfovibrio magneticus]|uniref:Uncharacterized protein n=1 Tax=Solidesulfovibrio magneticus (strain ATCC 700980 / DSM 13731 / RS-1) TaxID=573370 RepID=C4XQ40_SOLM1|nr:hypothetical protein [Solidesulfovibrio magneticus]BAH77739.1 hypothetical protein DMR_42480 [Solidesulfovibrio magneticus RS-1]
MPKCLSVALALALVLTGFAAPVPAQPGGEPQPAAPAVGTKAPDGPDLRRQVSDVRAVTATIACFYGPHIDQNEARRLCSAQARGKLLDTALAQFAHDPEVARSGIQGQDLRALADSLLSPVVSGEDIRPTPEGVAVRLTLRAETAPGALPERLAALAASPELRAAALAETAVRDRQAAEARMAAVPFAADRAFAAREMADDMRRDAAFAERSLAPGMSIAQVKELMGNPAALKQAVIGPESYLCAGYGKVWAVFRDGQLACLRSRLDYVRRYDTDCHCAGNYATILKND